jgi:hypothetical protein
MQFDRLKRREFIALQNAPIRAGFVLPFEEAQCFAPGKCLIFSGDAPPIRACLICALG